MDAVIEGEGGRMNGHGPKNYGPHKYVGLGTGKVECEHRCGCWIANSNSGGPLGLDPFEGPCPRNPVNGEFLGGDSDWHHVVEERIRQLTTRGHQAEAALERVRPTKVQLADALVAALAELADRDQLLAGLRRLLGAQPPSPQRELFDPGFLRKSRGKKGPAST